MKRWWWCRAVVVVWRFLWCESSVSVVYVFECVLLKLHENRFVHFRLCDRKSLLCARRARDFCFCVLVCICSACVIHIAVFVFERLPLIHQFHHSVFIVRMNNACCLCTIEQSAPGQPNKHTAPTNTQAMPLCHCAMPAMYYAIILYNKYTPHLHNTHTHFFVGVCRPRMCAK